MVAKISVIYEGNDETSVDLESEQGTGSFQLETSTDNNFLILVDDKGYMNIEESIIVSDYNQNLMIARKHEQMKDM